ncbi:hypothetical protein APHAL10511_000338 [Amanita phalloides]|nr:hypothetical protein APHAL10511_000338 [Amanita phalloides]
MPPVAPGSKVLVTGANGYVAIWVVHTLLEQGYTVRGAVRSVAKGAFLLEKFKLYGDRFELVIVDDFLKDGAFDEAVEGVDAIHHIAAPLTLKYKDPKEVIDPAVKGTLEILRSAQKTCTVKRIVLMGSAGAVARHDLDRPLDENDWNGSCVEEFVKKGVDTPWHIVYQAEKVLAEKAAWSFYNENKDQLTWDLAVLLPPLVLGPYAGPASMPGEMNFSSSMFYSYIVGFNSLGQPKEALVSLPTPWIDVRDLSFAMTKSLSAEAAAGERIIVSTEGSSTMQDWVDLANSLSPSPIPSHAPGTAKALPIGNPGAGKVVRKRILDTSKEKRILGLKYRSMEECARDTLADYERRGW